MNIQKVKRANSEHKVSQLAKFISESAEIKFFPGLSIFVAGSYARNEASEHSDIDLFFVLDGDSTNLESPRIRSIQLFSRIVTIGNDLGFPKFSNDGQYLQILELPKIIHELGGPNDDHLNYFTARMLMILESKCIYGSEHHDSILSKILDAYLRDYPDHPKEFLPTFLVNDILRFWKTLCLNYENKRNQVNEEKKIPQKIKNLKLKFSRMLTCYATICYVVAIKEPITVSSLLAMTELPPLERLRTVVANYPNTRRDFAALEKEYRWFLQLTNVSEAQLLADFSDRTLREEAFLRAERFGKSIFSITKMIAEEQKFLRYVLV